MNQKLVEFGRALDDQQFELKGHISGHAPVQAEGRIAGKRFYFRARYEAWTFAISDNENLDPADIDFPEQGFYREASYGKPRSYDASYMPYDDAETIIKTSAKEYLDARKP